MQKGAKSRSVLRDLWCGGGGAASKHPTDDVIDDEMGGGAPTSLGPLVETTGRRIEITQCKNAPPLLQVVPSSPLVPINHGSQPNLADGHSFVYPDSFCHPETSIARTAENDHALEQISTITTNATTTGVTSHSLSLPLHTCVTIKGDFTDLDNGSTEPCSNNIKTDLSDRRSSADISINIAPEGTCHDSGIESVEVSPCPPMQAVSLMQYAHHHDTNPCVHINKHINNSHANKTHGLLLHPDRAKCLRLPTSPEQSSLEEDWCPPSPTSSSTSSISSRGENLSIGSKCSKKSRCQTKSRSHNNLDISVKSDSTIRNVEEAHLQAIYHNSRARMFSQTNADWPVSLRRLSNISNISNFSNNSNMSVSSNISRRASSSLAHNDTNRRSSRHCSARYSLLDALDLDLESRYLDLLRSSLTNRDSIAINSLSSRHSLHKLTFTQSLAFPNLARGLASKRRRSTDPAIRRTRNSESNISVCIKIITTLILVTLSMLVFALVYKFVNM